MDENHDGEISQTEFIEVMKSHMMHFLIIPFIAGVHGSEKVLYNVDIKNS